MPTDEATVRASDRAHVFHSWSAQGAINPLPIARAEGSRFWDYQGKGYLDFTSGLVNVNIGYNHPRMIAAIAEQAGRMTTIAPGYAVDVRSEAARLIAERAPAGLNMPRLHPGRHKIFAAYRSYHGATAGALTMTGDPRRVASEPGIPGVVHFWGPYLYRSAFHAETEAQETQRALQHLRDLITVEGPGSVAAIIMETIVGTNGILVPPAGYLAGVRALCDEFGIVMIADEVMAGFGRIGQWYAVQHWDVTPDLITFAKGVNSGYVPLGGVVISDAIADTFRDRVYPGGLTYSGHPLACAAAVASIQIFEDEDVLGHARMLGEDVIGPELAKIADKHPSVGEVRGLGVFWALELVTDRDTRAPLVPYNASGAAAKPMLDFAAACKAQGLWPFTHFNRTHIVPPCTTSVEEVHEGLAIIDEALTVADGYYTE